MLSSELQVRSKDRVKTKSGRHGVVRATSAQDVAHVLWDDGEDFPIRFCHLEILAHDWFLPNVRKIQEGV